MFTSFESRASENHASWFIHTARSSSGATTVSILFNLSSGRNVFAGNGFNIFSLGNTQSCKISLLLSLFAFISLWATATGAHDLYIILTDDLISACAVFCDADLQIMVWIRSPCYRADVLENPIPFPTVSSFNTPARQSVSIGIIILAKTECMEAVQPSKRGMPLLSAL